MNFLVMSMIGVCDVSNKDAIFDCIQHMIKNFGHVDLLIANAGVSWHRRLTRPMQII